MFAASSISAVRPISRGLLALAVLGMLLASLLPIASVKQTLPVQSSQIFAAPSVTASSTAAAAGSGS